MSKKKALVLAAGLILLAALSSPMAALAADNDSTIVTGDLGGTIVVLAPDDFTMPALNPSASPSISSSKNVHVDANETWYLKAKGDAIGAGKMYSNVTHADTLASAMVLNAGEGNVTLTANNQNIVTAHAAGSADIGVVFTQAVAYTDKVHNDYTMTVTFTVGFTA